MGEFEFSCSDYQSRRLNFMERLVCSKKELSVLDFSPKFEMVMLLGKFDELEAYIGERKPTFEFEVLTGQ